MRAGIGGLLEPARQRVDHHLLFRCGDSSSGRATDSDHNRYPQRNIPGSLDRLDQRTQVAVPHGQCFLEHALGGRVSSQRGQLDRPPRVTQMQSENCPPGAGDSADLRTGRDKASIKRC